MEHHNIKPIFDNNSKILILGSFPSVKSREEKFFYAHPMNRFWKVIANITNTSLPVSIDEKKKMLIKNNIALWDVISSCDIIGSSDSSIKNVVVNDLDEILVHSKISTIYLNGTTSFNLFKKYNKNINIKSVKLPSTSPANARYSFDDLIDCWKVIKDDI